MSIYLLSTHDSKVIISWDLIDLIIPYFDADFMVKKLVKPIKAVNN